MVNYRTPGTRHLVHMKAHHKLITSVWIQLLNCHTLLRTAEKQDSHIMAIWQEIAQNTFSQITWNTRCELLKGCTHQTKLKAGFNSHAFGRFLRLQVAYCKDVVSAHRCTADCITDSLARGERRMTPAHGHCRWIAVQNSDLIWRWRSCCKLVSSR